MNIATFSKLSLTVGAVALISACTSGTGGGGGGGATGGGSAPKTVAEYNAGRNAVLGTPATSDMPTALSGTYRGGANFTLSEVGTGKTGNMLADLELAVNWTDGQTTNPWSGKADNLRGSYDGKDYTATGQLDVVDRPATATGDYIKRTVTNTGNIPGAPAGIPNVTVATGSGTIFLKGTFDGDGTPATANVILAPTFHGAGGSSIEGSALGTVETSASKFGGLGVGGTFYATK